MQVLTPATDKCWSVNILGVILLVCWTVLMEGGARGENISTYCVVQICAERCCLQPHGCDELSHDQKGVQNAGGSSAEDFA